MTSLYYWPSGRVPASALPIIALYAFATLPVAWIYAWLMIHVPAVINDRSGRIDTRTDGGSLRIA
jgi:hypothetical protein